ncbi:hypothetical protein [uncultured Weissella sp.]|uniref:hypothetical protein n=1 Tax=uncultured Weissella sp. TaxID=253243 RepID=UPI0025881FFB|nr:hypothetical protein [uncultured Weissella sp.]
MTESDRTDNSPEHTTETERVSMVRSLQLIEVTPGWYIESIPSPSWWFFVLSPEMGEELIAEAGITNNPLNAQDFTDFEYSVDAVLKPFKSAKLVTLDLSIKQR